MNMISDDVGHERYEGEIRLPTYVCERAKSFGTDGNGIVVGFTLTPIDDNWEVDPINDEIDNMGSDAGIILPAEPFVEGGHYKVRYVNITRDWETGIVDGWDIEVYQLTGDEHVEGKESDA